MLDKVVVSIFANGRLSIFNFRKWQAVGCLLHLREFQILEDKILQGDSSAKLMLRPATIIPEKEKKNGISLHRT